MISPKVLLDAPDCQSSDSQNYHSTSLTMLSYRTAGGRSAEQFSFPGQPGFGVSGIVSCRLFSSLFRISQDFSGIRADLVCFPLDDHQEVHVAEFVCISSGKGTEKDDGLGIIVVQNRLKLEDGHGLK